MAHRSIGLADGATSSPHYTLLYFTDDPLVGPHLFRRAPDGWRMDIVAEVRDTRNGAGGIYAWDWRGEGDDFSRVFADTLVTIRGHVRIAGGDNRPLPVTAARSSRP